MPSPIAINWWKGGMFQYVSITISRCFKQRASLRVFTEMQRNQFQMESNGQDVMILNMDHYGSFWQTNMTHPELDDPQHNDAQRPRSIIVSCGITRTRSPGSYAWPGGQPCGDHDDITSLIAARSSHTHTYGIIWMHGSDQKKSKERMVWLWDSTTGSLNTL